MSDKRKGLPAWAGLLGMLWLAATILVWHFTGAQIVAFVKARLGEPLSDLLLPGAAAVGLLVMVAAWGPQIAANLRNWIGRALGFEDARQAPLVDAPVAKARADAAWLLGARVQIVDYGETTLGHIMECWADVFDRRTFDHPGVSAWLWTSFFECDRGRYLSSARAHELSGYLDQMIERKLIEAKKNVHSEEYWVSLPPLAMALAEIRADKNFKPLSRPAKV